MHWFCMHSAALIIALGNAANGHRISTDCTKNTTLIALKFQPTLTFFRFR
jgi:hypothetical protein